jgi:hypothetical protein
MRVFAIAGFAVAAALAGAPANATVLHCVIPDGAEHASGRSADFTVDTARLDAPDWRAWGISGRPGKLLGDGATARRVGERVIIERFGREEGTAFRTALTIDTASGAARVDQSLTLGREVAVTRKTGSCVTMASAKAQPSGRI